MKIKLFGLLLILSLISCDFFESTNSEGYRDGSDSGVLVNGGSLVGSWETTHEWQIYEHQPSDWIIVNPSYSDSFTFFEDGTFISANVYNGCSSNEGKYYIEGEKIRLVFICESEDTEEVYIDEFFYREEYVVFIEEAYGKIYKLELVK